MNPLYEQMFNSQHVNEDYLQTLQRQKYHNEQCAEISKAVKAIHDYCDAARKISPEYQNEAFIQCAMAALEEMGKNNVI